MQSWAFAVSPHPHGLGLSESHSWLLTPRELHALVEVHDQGLRRWALERAMYANAHFRAQDTVAFIPDDFLGLANREERQREEALSQQIVMQENMRLSRIKKGEPPTEEVPDWARGPYLGKGFEDNA